MSLNIMRDLLVKMGAGIVRLGYAIICQIAALWRTGLPIAFCYFFLPRASQPAWRARQNIPKIK